MSASSFLMEAVIAGWDTSHASAAREMLPCSHTARKYLI